MEYYSAIKIMKYCHLSIQLSKYCLSNYLNTVYPTWIDSENIIQNRNRLTTRKQLIATKRERERGKE